SRNCQSLFARSRRRDSSVAIVDVSSAASIGLRDVGLCRCASSTPAFRLSLLVRPPIHVGASRRLWSFASLLRLIALAITGSLLWTCGGSSPSSQVQQQPAPDAGTPQPPASPAPPAPPPSPPVPARRRYAKSSSRTARSAPASTIAARRGYTTRS